MKPLKRAALAGAKLWLLLAAVAIGVLAMAPGSRPVDASSGTTAIYFTYSITDLQPVSFIITAPGGPAIKLYVWAQNPKDPDWDSGVGAFEVNVEYDPAILTVTSIVEDASFLEPTNRAIDCNAAVIEPVIDSEPAGLWHANVGCTTIGSLFPKGPQDSGLLATVWLQPSQQIGNTSLALGPTAFSQGTRLVTPGHTKGPNLKPPTAIPATVTSAPLTIAPCADFDADGSVGFSDFLILLQHYTHAVGTDAMDGTIDVNEDGSVGFGDFLVLLAWYNQSC